MQDFAVMSAALTHRGRRRPHNEDFVTFYEPASRQQLETSGRLYIVADGVGGAAKGEIASQYAAQKVLYEFFRSSEPDLEGRLSSIIRQAGLDIRDYAEQGRGFTKMATTIVAAAIHNQHLTVAHVGDSRIYLIRGGQAHVLTWDHTQTGEMVKYGEITEEEAQLRKGKSTLTRSLGGHSDVYVDVVTQLLQQGDVVLLCSDGFSRYASKEDIVRLTTSFNHPDQIAEACIEYANKCGGADNISVIVIKVGQLVPLETAATMVAPQLTPGVPTIGTGSVPRAVSFDELMTDAPIVIHHGRVRTQKRWAIAVMVAASVLIAAGALFLSLNRPSSGVISGQGEGEGGQPGEEMPASDGVTPAPAAIVDGEETPSGEPSAEPSAPATIEASPEPEPQVESAPSQPPTQCTAIITSEGITLTPDPTSGDVPSQPLHAGQRVQINAITPGPSNSYALQVTPLDNADIPGGSILAGDYQGDGVFGSLRVEVVEDCHSIPGWGDLVIPSPPAPALPPTPSPRANPWWDGERCLYEVQSGDIIVDILGGFANRHPELGNLGLDDIAAGAADGSMVQFVNGNRVSYHWDTEDRLICEIHPGDILDITLVPDAERCSVP